MLNVIQRLPAYANLAAALGEESTRAALPPQALLAAARPALVAALAAAQRGPILFVTARNEMATQWVEQLNQWLPAPEAGGPQVLHLADPDALPYERIHWSSATRQRRLTALAALQGRANEAGPGGAARGGVIVVAAARALMQKTLPARELRMALRPLKVGQVVRLDQMTLQWVQTGYNPADVVEEAGTFARRGGIVDIWPPNLPNPVRIDLFGDEVESLRLFDPATQRTLRKVESVEIGPGSEALSKYGPNALERLHVRGGSLAAPENVAAPGQITSPLNDPALLLTVREEMRLEVQHLAQGHSFHGIEWYLPYIYGQPAGPVEHLPADGLLIVDDALDLFATLNELENQATALCLELQHTGELPKDYVGSNFSTEEVRAALLARNPLLLGFGDLYSRSAAGNTPLARCFAPGPRFGGKTKQIASELRKIQTQHDGAVIVTRQAARMQELLRDHDMAAAVQSDLERPPGPGVTLIQGILGEGFVIKDVPGLASGDQGANGSNGRRGSNGAHTENNVHLFTDAELFGWSRPQARSRPQHHSRVAPELFFADVKVGDFVVHIEHGIGQFDGLTRIQVGGVDREYLQVNYARGDKLYVPVHQADRLSRYVGAGERVPPISRLGTADWALTKERARKAIADIADDLLKLYAERELVQGHVYSPDGPWQDEMEAAFPYEETDDQLHAIEAVKRDMESERPMDRLICGDVGYGKTEVAIRAAFKAMMDGKQIAMLVPTTVLALQHYRTLSRRLAKFPVRVEMMSRFRTHAQQKQIMEGLRNGTVDMVVGTHRLLAQDLEFKDLGMVIIDEEQRFGVGQKEKLKILRNKVDVLTLSATPIPRTLHMSLSGLRDMSTINTPPRERQPIHTVLSEWDDTLLRQAIQRELNRDGQVFIVTDKVRGIQALADRVRHLVPEASVVVGHGQMHETELEEVMMRFSDGEFDVLVATTIIENGLDIQNANTIIINRAEHFGLAQLYQLRGRVGRSAQRGYCYLLHEKNSPLSYDAQRRLSAIIESSEELGAGFRIAMRDLEIRGAGELLGAKQHGHIDSIGFDLYTRLVAQAVNDARKRKERFDQAVKQNGEGEEGAADADGSVTSLADAAPALQVAEQAAVALAEDAAPAAAQATAPARDDLDTPFDMEDPLAAPVTLDLPIDARIPIAYVEDEGLRLQLYRRIAAMTHVDGLEEMRRELIDRFGADAETGGVPEEVDNLFYQIRVKTLAARAGVERIGRDLEQIVLYGDALENMDRRSLERRLRMALGKLSDENGRFVPEESARVGRRAIYLPIDDDGRWQKALLRTLEIMAVG
jgi:transcription-repair coupling factor (superfamily II helicase)